MPARLTGALLLVIALISSTSCSATRSDPCHWVKPIVFSDETKDWLDSMVWPDSAYRDFD